MIYKYYDPHPQVCRMKQYECCKNYHDTCPLYYICKEMKGYAEASRVCKQDCPTCDYEGCTMSKEKRLSEPLYVKGLTYSEPIPLPIENIKEVERRNHLKEHRNQYHKYNMLFSEEYRLKKQSYREKKRERINEQKRKSYHKNHPTKKEKQVKEINPLYLPPCKYDCFNCNKPDCDLPENYYQQQISKQYYERNKDIVLARGKKRQQEHPEKSREYCKRSYQKNREKRLEYAKSYRENHKEERKAFFKEWYEKNRDTRQEYMKKYRAEHKAQINQKRREKYAARKNISLKIENLAV